MPSVGGRDVLDVVVVGAGAAGVAAARRLASEGLSVAVLEREAHSGGRLLTGHHDGAQLERGGVFHTDRYPATLELLEEVGLTTERVTSPTAFHCAVRHRGTWRHVEYGSLSGLLRTGVLGAGDKLSVMRAALPALRTRPHDLGDLAGLEELDTGAATEGLSAKTATYLTAGPHGLLWGVPSDRLSFAVLALQLHVFKGHLHELRGGASRLMDALVEGLDMRTGSRVRLVEPSDEGVAVHVEGSHQPVRAHAAILACPADVAAELWPSAPVPVRDHLTGIGYSRIDGVYLRTKERVRLRAGSRTVTTEILPTPEVGSMTMGGAYAANAWTDDGGLLLVTAAHAADAGRLSDDELADRLQADVEQLHPEVASEVTERTVMRHGRATPTFTPGSVRRLAAARRRLPAGRVDLAGDHMAAPWVEGAIRSGQLAAERTAASLRA